MNVKRFVAPTMRAALQQVREEMGADAVILVNRKVDKGVEIMAALDEQAAAPAPTPTPAAVPFQRKAEPAALQPEQSAPVKAERRQPNETQALLENALQDDHIKDSLLKLIQQKQLNEQAQVAAQQQTTQQAASKPQAQTQPVDQSKNQQSQQDFSQKLAAKKAEMVQAVAPVNDQQNEMIKQMRLEIQSMRDMLKQQFSTMAWSQLEAREPEKAVVWGQLLKLGIQPEVAESILSELAAKGDSHCNFVAMNSLLESRIQTFDRDITVDGGVVALVGPTGAGKTTTIGKLATRYVLEHGSDSVAVISTDSYRVAGQEQLRVMANLLNITMRSVDRNNSLSQILHSLRHKKLILIDTAGYGNDEQRLSQQRNMLNELGGDVKTLLVLPANNQAEVLQANVARYKSDNLIGCVITKLDESLNVGASMSIAIQYELPIAFTTAGQEIPEDIDLPKVPELLQMAQGLSEEKQISDTQLGEKYFANQQIAS